MRTAYFLLTIVLFSCTGHSNIDNNKFTREIPNPENGDFDLFYELTLDKSNQLKLDSIENGYDSIQIRIWYDYSLIKDRKLLVLKSKKGVWDGTLYKMKVKWDWEATKETIENVEKVTVTPEGGWDKFTKKIFDLQISTLPNMDDIPNLEDGWTDGVTYNVEIATKNMYRFYGYHLPEEFQDNFWQAKNMVEILDLIKNELKINWEFER